MSTPTAFSHPGLSRPATLHGSKSFSRMEAAHSASSARARASTLQIGSTLDSSKSREMHIQRVEDLNGQNGDIFDKDSSIALDASNDSPTAKEMPRDAPVGFDDLPIELLSLTDRYGAFC